MRFRGLLAAAVLFAAARAAGAQGSGTLIPIRYRSYVAINPLGIPFDIGSIEVESAVAPGITTGGVASYTDLDDSRFLSFDFKVRYYPGEVVLRGFSLGLSAGVLRYSSVPDTVRQRLTAPALGVLADYNWMLGAERRFLVGTGLGAKRILATHEDRDRVGIDQAYVTVRFVVGLAF